MQGANGFLIAAYIVVWLGFFAYLGWLALRMRGVRTELETVRALVDEHDRAGGQEG
jgi:CcmD family protein